MAGFSQPVVRPRFFPTGSKDAITKTVGAAGLQFVDDPDRLTLYTAVLPTAKKSPKPAAPKA